MDKSFHHSCIDSLLSLLLCWLRWLLFDFLSPGEHRATSSQSALTCRNWTGGVINSLAPDPAPEPRIGCTAALTGCTASRKVEICEAASGCQAEFGILRVVVKWSQFVKSKWVARWTGAAARPVISLSSRLAIVVGLEVWHLVVPLIMSDWPTSIWMYLGVYWWIVEWARSVFCGRFP